MVETFGIYKYKGVRRVNTARAVFAYLLVPVHTIYRYIHSNRTSSPVLLRTEPFRSLEAKRALQAKIAMT